MPFYVSYQDPAVVCFTRNNDENENTIRIEDQSLWHQIYRARTMLKGTFIFISEVLSSSDQFLFFLSRKMKKTTELQQHGLIKATSIYERYKGISNISAARAIWQHIDSLNLYYLLYNM